MDQDQEQSWRRDFERVVLDAVRREHNMFPEPKRQAAFRWMRERERERETRERNLYRFAKWTFFAAVFAALVGLVAAIEPLLK